MSEPKRLADSGLSREDADAVAEALLVRFGNPLKIHQVPECGLSWWFISAKVRPSEHARMVEFYQGFLEGRRSR